MTYTLIGTAVSLYTGKARGYLRWKNVPFREQLSTVDIYKSIILPRIGWPVVPVLLHEDGSEHGVAVQDTTEIIDYVEAREPGPSVYPAGPVQKLAALILELFGDEWLVIPAMHYRWAYNRDFAQAEFGATSYPDLPPAEQRAAVQKSVDFFSGALPVLGINPDSVAAVEAAFEAFLAAFEAHLGTQDFLLGTRPSIGDYGFLGPLYAHLLRDPASGAIMERLAPRVADWARRTHAPQHALTGEFVANDELSPTLLPILEMFAAQQLPVLLDTAKALADWSDANPEVTELPRMLGFNKAMIGHGDNVVETDRAIFPYPLWMLQRVTDHLASLEGDARARADKMLRSIGAAKLIDFTLPIRLARKNFKLVRG
ncbi:glutathione S-transferase N-terminal domain-containing protein [uncultured Maricaulis sp.]|uniref:glutathione S-transferase N-terminal domain-containing protein n=1 Tax=uncultured Maricaulis sp. TaxID=174710 RepID=UPI0030D93D9A